LWVFAAHSALAKSVAAGSQKGFWNSIYMQPGCSICHPTTHIVGSSSYSACGQLVPGTRDIEIWRNSLPPHLQREEKSSYMESLTGRASVCCLELLETIFNGIERLSRNIPVLHQLASQSSAGQDTDSKMAMKASAK
jgi:hypothetical protein